MNEKVRETVNNSDVNLYLLMANKDRDYRIFEYIFKRTLKIKGESLKKLEKIKIVDSILIKTCASMVLPPEEDTRAIKTHLLLDFNRSSKRGGCYQRLCQ